MQELGDNIVCIILAASDPFAVVGVQKAFDVTTGPRHWASSEYLSSRSLLSGNWLTNLPAMNVIDRDTLPEFTTFLGNKLGCNLLAA